MGELVSPDGGLVWDEEGVEVVVTWGDRIRAYGLRWLILAMGFGFTAVGYLQFMASSQRVLALASIMVAGFLNHIYSRSLTESSAVGEGLRRILGEEWTVAFVSTVEGGQEPVVARFTKRAMEIVGRGRRIDVEKGGPVGVSVSTSGMKWIFGFRRTMSMIHLKVGEEHLFLQIFDNGRLVQRAYESGFVEVHDRLTGRRPG